MKEFNNIASRFTTYQEKSRRTWSRVKLDHSIVYPTLGLVNEAGEVAGKVKKIFRDKNGIISNEDKIAIQGELGDVLWYLTQICTDLDISLQEVAEKNLQKLDKRLKAGTLKGEGDNR